MRKVKCYKVRVSGKVDYLSGLEVALLQLSGGHVKVVRRLTEAEIEEFKMNGWVG